MSEYLLFTYFTLTNHEYSKAYLQEDKDKDSVTIHKGTKDRQTVGYI